MLLTVVLHILFATVAEGVYLPHTITDAEIWSIDGTHLLEGSIRGEGFTATSLELLILTSVKGKLRGHAISYRCFSNCGGLITGTFSGSASQGRSISFDVERSGIYRISYEVRIQLSRCSVTVESTIERGFPIRIIGNSFSYSSHTSDGLAAFSGEF